jgi:hypothetical protein
MKTQFLFPNRFKRIGWFILIPSVLAGIVMLTDRLKIDFLEVRVFALYSKFIFEDQAVFGLVKNNIADEILTILCIVGGILVAFSEEKQEDEFIAKTRTESLVWATYVNYAVLIFCTLFFYGIAFWYVIILNLFTMLFFFIIRFYYQLYKANKSMGYEK